MKTPIISVERTQALTHSGDSHWTEQRDQLVRVHYAALTSDWLSQMDPGAYRALLLMLLKAETLDMQKLAVFQKHDFLRDDGVGRLFSLTTDVGLKRDLGSGLNAAKRALKILHEAQLIETWRIPSDAQTDFSKVGLWGNEVHLIRGDGPITLTTGAATFDQSVSVCFFPAAIAGLIFKRKGNPLKLITAIALHARSLKPSDIRLFDAFPEMTGGDLDERLFCFTTDEGLADECGFDRDNLKPNAQGLPYIECWEIPKRARQQFRNQLRFNGTHIYVLLKNPLFKKSLPTGRALTAEVTAQIPVDVVSEAWARTHDDVPLVSLNIHQDLCALAVTYDAAAKSHGDSGESWLLAAIEKSRQAIRRNEQSIINYIVTCLKDWQQNGPRFRASAASPLTPKESSRSRTGKTQSKPTTKKAKGIADDLSH